MSAQPTSRDLSAVQELTISDHGLTAKFLTLGSVLRSLRLEGVDHDLTLGAADIHAYLGNFRFGGAIVGPVANRIGMASAPLGDQRLTLLANEGSTCLHGGPQGLDAQIWQVIEHRPNRLTLSLSLADQEDGWPGARQIKARWWFPAPGTLALELTATTDAPTLFAPAQHGYWRLGPGQDLTGHRLFSPAETYTEVDAAKIPTGAMPKVEGTAFDFRGGAPVGPEASGRIDHNLCISERRGELRQVCVLQGPSARMTVHSTEPGLQIYDAAHFAHRQVSDLNGKNLVAFAGLAIEPQLWPDAANQPDWQSPRLDPGETYRQETHWRFDAL